MNSKFIFFPYLLFFSLLLSGSIGFYFYNSKPVTVIDEILEKKNIYGNPLNQSYKTAEFLIVNFWASWCPPCILETPSLVKFVETNKGKFYLFAISQDSSPREIEEFLKTFPSLKNRFAEVIWDDNKNLARKLDVEKLPETFIYSAKTKKFIQISGATDWQSPELEKYLNEQFKKL